MPPVLRVSSTHLVIGCCFFFGGLYHKEQSFNSTAATANMGLLALSAIGLVLPTPFASYYELHDEQVLLISRTTALFLMFMYFQLLFFQLKTHAHVFEDNDGDDDELAMIPFGVAVVGLLIVTLLVAFPVPTVATTSSDVAFDGTSTVNGSAPVIIS